MLRHGNLDIGSSPHWEKHPLSRLSCFQTLGFFTVLWVSMYRQPPRVDDLKLVKLGLKSNLNTAMSMWRRINTKRRRN